MKQQKNNSFWAPVKINLVSPVKVNRSFIFHKNSYSVLNPKPNTNISNPVKNNTNFIPKLKNISNGMFDFKPQKNNKTGPVLNSKFIPKSNFISLPKSNVNFIPKQNNNSLAIVNTNTNIPKKQMNWVQAKTKFPRLNPFKDADRDGVMNMYDCKPFNKMMQDAASKAYFAKIKKINKERNKKLKKIKKYEDNFLRLHPQKEKERLSVLKSAMEDSDVSPEFKAEALRQEKTGKFTLSEMSEELIKKQTDTPRTSKEIIQGYNDNPRINQKQIFKQVQEKVKKGNNLLSPVYLDNAKRTLTEVELRAERRKERESIEKIKTNERLKMAKIESDAKIKLKIFNKKINKMNKDAKEEAKAKTIDAGIKEEAKMKREKIEKKRLAIREKELIARTVKQEEEKNIKKERFERRGQASQQEMFMQITKQQDKRMRDFMRHKPQTRIYKDKWQTPEDEMITIKKIIDRREKNLKNIEDESRIKQDKISQMKSEFMENERKKEETKLEKQLELERTVNLKKQKLKKEDLIEENLKEEYPDDYAELLIEDERIKEIRKEGIPDDSAQSLIDEV